MTDKDDPMPLDTVLLTVNTSLSSSQTHRVFQPQFCSASMTIMNHQTLQIINQIMNQVNQLSNQLSNHYQFHQLIDSSAFEVDHMGSVFALGGALMGAPPHHHGPALNSLVYGGGPQRFAVLGPRKLRPW